MTAQEIHEYIWGEVCKALSRPDGIHLSKIGVKRRAVDELRAKSNVVDELCDNGKVSAKALDILSKRNLCVLCALYQDIRYGCEKCPLYRLADRNCNVSDSLYDKVLNGDWETAKEAALTIKNMNVLDGEYDAQTKAVLEGKE